MSIFRKLVDAFSRPGRALADQPSGVRAGTSPGGYGMHPADSRPNGSGDIKADRLEGQSSIAFSKGEDFGLSRKPVPATHDVRTTPTTPRPAVPAGGMAYGEHPGVRRDNQAWASDSAHQPSTATDAPRSTQQSASTGRTVKR